VEALLAVASPEPPPIADVLADLRTLIDVPADLPDLLTLATEADLYLQDEITVALHPTLTRLWSPTGRRRQRLIEAPGANARIVGFGAVDWREGTFLGLGARGREAFPFAVHLHRLAERSRARGRRAIVLLDNLRIHTPAGSRLTRYVLTEQHADILTLVYTPAYDPDANRIEWLWRPTRRAVTHAHDRTHIDELTVDLAEHFLALATDPATVLRHIGSPHAPLDPSEEATDAA
jgi:hypothetical protein